MIVFLFNDILLIARERKNVYEYRRVLNLAHSKFINLGDMFTGSSFSWEIEDSKKKETTFFTSTSNDDKQIWMKSIQKIIKEYQREQFASKFFCFFFGF